MTNTSELSELRMGDRGGRGGGGNGRGGRGGGRGAGRGNPRPEHSGGGVEATEGAVARMNLGAGPARQDMEQGRRARRPTFLERVDFVPTRKDIKANTKMGTAGQPIRLHANFYSLRSKTDWAVFAYWVDFKPEQRSTALQKGLLSAHKEQLGTYIFDGRCLWTAARLKVPLTLVSTTHRTQEVVELSIKLVGESDPGDPARLQFYNILLRSCYGPDGLDLVQIRRNFFDKAAAKPIPINLITIWPGVVTTLRQFENELLLNVNIVHKILRTESCWDTLQKCRDQAAMRDKLVGGIVMTAYNNKTYKIDDIDFSKTPASTFPMKDGSEMSYVAYYKTKYSLEVKNLKQPLLMSRPSARDFHRGETQNIYLIPELCNSTGLTDDERANYSFMRAVHEVTQQKASAKMGSIQAFMDRLSGNEGVKGRLDKWGMRYNSRPMDVEGRLLPAEKIFMEPDQLANGKSVPKAVPYDRSDWTGCFQKRKMKDSKRLDKWVVINTRAQERELVGSLVSKMIEVARPLGFIVAQPADVKVVTDRRIDSVLKLIREAVEQYGKLDLILVILPDKGTELYGSVKRECCAARVASQCVVGRTIQPGSKLLSVVTKLVIQINAKLGGQPWAVEEFFPRPNMVIGFDVFHGKGQAGRQSVAAMVASTNRCLSTYYSTTTKHENREEISSKMCLNITKCVKAFASRNNGWLPEKIVFFRDGVGEGQLTEVVSTELKEIQRELKEMYEAGGKDPPALTFIVVTKRINARVYQPSNAGYSDPPPGTVVDSVITQPERYDFYLVSQKAPNQGSVTPTAYNVIWDDNNFTPDQIHRYTFRQTHTYFNWGGTVSVPGVNQYAHKLAYLVGKYGLSETAIEAMSHTLYYL